MEATGDECKRAAEAKLRRELAKIQAEIWEKYSGNDGALRIAMNRGMNLIVDAVRCGDLSPLVAEGLKKQIQDWTY